MLAARLATQRAVAEADFKASAPTWTALDWRGRDGIIGLEELLVPRERTALPSSRIERLIYEVRGQRVMLDQDLAELYGVTTAALNQAVRRNRRRFPADFAFDLARDEFEALRSQNVISKPVGRGGRRSLPIAFTEQGVAMLSSVLRSARAIDVNVAIMRAFVRVRQVLAGHATLLVRLDALERHLGVHSAQFKAVFAAIRSLMTGGRVPSRRRIGYTAED